MAASTAQSGVLSAPPKITIPRFAPITNMVLKYDGIRDYLVIPGPPNPDSIESLSIEIWLHAEVLSGKRTIWGTAISDAAFYLEFDNNKIRLGYNNSGIFDFPYEFQEKQWYYIVITYSSTQKLTVLYVNGEEEGSGVLLDAQAVKPWPAWIACQAPPESQFFYGNIGTIRIWDDVLNQINVQTYMYMTLTGQVETRDADGNVVATLIGNWRCNEGYGNIAFDYSQGVSNAQLGGGNPDDIPEWVVSTRLKPPDFIKASGASDSGGIQTQLAIVEPDNLLLTNDNSANAEGAQATAELQTKPKRTKRSTSKAKTSKRVK